MPAVPVPADVPAADRILPWRTCALSVAILAVQVALIDRLVGEEMLGITKELFDRRIFRKEMLMAVLAACVAILPHVRRHLDAYRLAPLSPARLAGQGIAFAGLFTFLAAMAAGLPPSAIGHLPTQVVAAGLAILWMASMTLLLPRGTAVAPVVAGALFGPAVLAAGFWIADRGTSVFWDMTAGFTTQLVAWMLAPFAGAPVVRPAPHQIGTRDFSVSIYSPCSGWQGILLITTLFAGYLWWFRRMLRFPRALLLFPVGIVLIYLANAVRITALILVGIWISPQIAVDGFHSQAGWVAFLVVGLGIVWTASRMPFFLAEGAAGGGAASVTVDGAGEPRTACGPTVTACLVPFLALLVTTIVTGLFSVRGSLDVLYPARVVVVGGVLWCLRGSFDFRWREALPSPLAVGIGGLVFVMWILLAPAHVAADAVAAHDPARLGPVWGPIWLVFRVVGSTVTVPIAEELAFRGFVARRLVSEDVERVPLGTFSWPSFLGSSLAFGALHQADWVPGTLAGMAFALALYGRGRLADAIAAHATTNALLTISVIVTGAWASWG